jgi:hypothetical protein
MKRMPLFLLVALFASFAGPAQAGWGHHRHVYQAAPAYYVPAFAPAFSPFQVTQSAPQSGLADILIAKLLEGAIGNINRVTPGPSPTPQPIDMSSVQRDLADLKASLANLDSRVENVNSTLTRHGESIIAIQNDLKDLKVVKDSVTAGSPLATTLSEVNTKLHGKSIDEIKKALDDAELTSKLKDIIKDETKFANTIKEIKDKLDKLK